MTPDVHYAKGPEGQVAYQITGGGPVDIVFVPDWVTNVEVMWEEAAVARFLARLGSIGRLITYDKRGTGISDPVPLGALPTLERWMDDIGNVLDAAGAERAVVVADGDGGAVARPCAGPGVVQRHRGLHRARHPARRPCLARSARAARHRRTSGAGPLPRPGDPDDGRRLLRDLRRSRTRGALCAGHPRGGAPAWPRDPCRPAHRRGRAAGRRRARHRRAPARPAGPGGERGRGAGLRHSEGSGHGIGPALRGARRPSPQGRGGRVAVARRGVASSGYGRQEG